MRLLQGSRSGKAMSRPGTQSQWREVDSELARSWVGEELKTGVCTEYCPPLPTCAFRVMLDKQPRTKGWDKEGGFQVRGLLSQGRSTSSRYVMAPVCLGLVSQTELSLRQCLPRRPPSGARLSLPPGSGAFVLLGKASENSSSDSAVKPTGAGIEG